MKLIRILILEDNIIVLAAIFRSLVKMDERLLWYPDVDDIAATVFSEGWQVDEYLNSSKRETFDIILLDRDSKSNGSFHTLDIKKFKTAEVIGISSIPEYNQDLRVHGVTRIINKELSDLAGFTNKLEVVLEEVLKEKYSQAQTKQSF